MAKRKTGEPATSIKQARSSFNPAIKGFPDLQALAGQFNQLLDSVQSTAEDPLGILGHPNPTPAERKAVEALAKQLNRPPKLCRRALIKSDHDLAKAKALLSDLDFCRRHVEYPIDLSRRIRNPYLAQIEYLRIEAPYLGRTEQDIAPQIAKLQKQADRYEKKRQAVKQQGGPPNRLNDPVLGDLKWDEFYWEGQVDIPEFGKMSLTVDTDSDSNLRKLPDDKQRAALKAFVAGAARLHAAIEEANFKYFQGARQSYEQSGMPVPKVQSAQKLWKHLSSPGLAIPPQRGKSWKIELTFACTWEEEHGHLVGIRDGKVAYVGLQGDGW